jgi:FMN reductase
MAALFGTRDIVVSAGRWYLVEYVISGLEDSAGRPFVIGVGGSARPGSTTDCALRVALAAAERGGAATRLFDGAFLAGLPHYAPGSPDRTDDALRLLAAVRSADGVLIASPGYHGGVSGLVKNALDYIEDLREDERPYLDGRAVGCIVTAFGAQASASTLAGLRSVVHALRAWPTPLGVALNTAEGIFDAAGDCTDQKASTQLELVAHQVVTFAGTRHRVPVADTP